MAAGFLKLCPKTFPAHCLEHSGKEKSYSPGIDLIFSTRNIAFSGWIITLEREGGFTLDSFSTGWRYEKK
jgi:hypothetical protein